MKIKAVNQAGVGHVLVVGLVAVVTVVGVTYVGVKDAHDNNARASVGNASVVAKKDSLKAEQRKADGLEPVSSPSQAVTSPTTKPPTTAPTTEKVTTTKPAPATAPITTKGAPVAPAPAQTPAQLNASLLSILTEVIGNFETKGAPLNVTRDVVTVSGPINNATARPIVFGYHDTLYFAYSQTTAPNFKLSPSDTAKTMAIMPANTPSIAQVSAHLDKVGNLVDPNSALVGYSIGGNVSGR